MSLCELYDCDYLHTHIYPVALSLAEDKVAEVRATATQLVRLYLFYTFLHAMRDLLEPTNIEVPKRCL